MGIVNSESEFEPERENRIPRVYTGQRELTDTGRVFVGLSHQYRQPNAAPVTRHKRRWLSWMRGHPTMGEAVASAIVAAVIGIALGLLLAHGLAGGFRTAHHVAVTSTK